MKRRICFYVVCLVAMIFLINNYMAYLTEMAKLQNILDYEETKEKIRAQELTLKHYEEWREWGKEGTISCYDYMCTYFITGEVRKTELINNCEKLQKFKPEQYAELLGYLTAIWQDIAYFPVPDSSVNTKNKVTFVNSWMYERTFGGKRGHEGTDFMAVENKRGRYPIVSISEGVVEKIGWLTQGGYRIGIRSFGGGYFYYAHLYDYARDFQLGDRIHAGELLGFMGDSGYSELEGTVGNFDVHLHLGIYVNQPDGTEMSINPYWITKYLEKHKLVYQFY
ncbi:M23 family metallopeptidase [Lachnospiraceae bacterium ZAX-1]